MSWIKFFEWIDIIGLKLFPEMRPITEWEQEIIGFTHRENEEESFLVYTKYFTCGFLIYFLLQMYIYQHYPFNGTEQVFDFLFYFNMMFFCNELTGAMWYKKDYSLSKLGFFFIVMYVF